MAEANESAGWASGLVSNSSATSSAHRTVLNSLTDPLSPLTPKPENNRSATHSAGGVDALPSATAPEDQSQEAGKGRDEVPSEGEAHVLAQLTRLMRAISLTPQRHLLGHTVERPIDVHRAADGSQPTPVISAQGPPPLAEVPVSGDQQPIFFSTIPRATPEGVDCSVPSERSSSASITDHLSESAQGRFGEKIRNLLRADLQSDRETATSQGPRVTFSCSNESKQSHHYPAVSSDVPRAHASMGSLARENSDESEARGSAVGLLEEKCRAQELLIERLYADVLRAEERLAAAEGSERSARGALQSKEKQWERERVEWARECARLATQLQTVGRPAEGQAREQRLVPLSSFAGFDGSKKTHLSVVEELHYTRGYNSALRAEVLELKAQLAAKDTALTDFSARLRDAYLTRAGLGNATLLLRDAPSVFPTDRGTQRDPRRCTACSSSRGPQDPQKDQCLVEAFLGLIEARDTAHRTKRAPTPRRASVSAAPNRGRSPFRNTIL